MQKACKTRNSASNLISAALVAACFYTGAANANLIANGDFEAGIVNDAVPSWTISNSANVFVYATYPSNNPFWYGGGSAAQNGDYAAVFNAGDRSPNGTLSQTFSTSVGTQYMVSFDYGASAGGGQSLYASVLGFDTTIELINVIASDFNPLSPLSSFSFAFTANGSQSTLKFADYSGNYTVSLDGILDNVSVVAVPEPETYAMTLSGLALLGLVTRRRKRKVA